MRVCKYDYSPIAVAYSAVGSVLKGDVLCVSVHILILSMDGFFFSFFFFFFFLLTLQKAKQYNTCWRFWRGSSRKAARPQCAIRFSDQRDKNIRRRKTI